MLPDDYRIIYGSDDSAIRIWENPRTGKHHYLGVGYCPLSQWATHRHHI